MKSPFKFLDSYTKEDRDIFFGREREIEELYHRAFESKIMLVYGVSGTGKSSLIHCGLANKFQETDWLPLVIRRGGNMLDSLATAIKSASITPQSGEIQTAQQFKKAVRSLYLDHYKPVFFIFDQFEELFIFGSKDEDESFIKVLKSLLSSEIQCKFIFILREEFLGWLTTFEKSVPGFFSNRIRIEKMDIGNARKVIEGPCKIYNIDVQEGFADKMLEKLCPPKESEIELTYLQVYLDKVFKLASEGNKDDADKIIFNISDLDKAGNVFDILGSFLDGQISQLPDPEVAMTILKAFVSARGTKRPVNMVEIREYALSTGKVIDEKTINDLLISFVNLRILQEKDRNEKYELRHDALAAKIFEKITMVEKELLEIRQLIENAYHNWEKRGILLSADDLQYIAPYETRLYLPDNYSGFVERSKRELVKAQHRRRNMLTAAAIALIIILTGFTLWAVRERAKAVANEKIANEEKIKATSSEKEALIARDKAVESDTKAIASEKEALKARDAAKESELRAFQAKEIAERRELQARANNFNFLSKETVAHDPTIALRLAVYALSLDSTIKAIRDNLNRIYYDNIFYKIFFRATAGSITQISSDWTKIVSTDGRTGILTDINGNNQRLLIGHLISVFDPYDAHNISRRGFDNIISIAFSPDGNFVITGSVDQTARLWDLNGNSLKVFKGHQHWVRSVIFSPDGKTILTGSSDRTAKLWDMNGNCLKTFSGHKYDILSVAFSPDGQKILTGSADSLAILWDLNGNILQKFKGHTGYVLQVAFSPDGRNILTGSSDQTARLWDLGGKTLQVFNGHTDNVNTIAFSPDGKTILTGSSDKTARLWNLNGNTLQVFMGHTGPVYSVAYSPEGTKILTSCNDGITRIWDLSQNVFMNITDEKSEIRKVLYSPEGKTILTLSTDQTAKLWDLTGDKLASFHLTSNTVAFSPDGKTILTGFLAAQLLDLNGNVLQTFTGHTKGISSLAFSPDGKTILTGSMDKTARLYDLKGNVLQVFTGHTQGITSVAFSPDGKKIITGSADNTARLWDLTGNTLQIFTGHSDYVNSVAFSSDGKTILTGSWDKTARLWDLNGRTLQVFSGHTQSVAEVAFSPDNRLIMTGSNDKTVRIWDLNGNTLQIISGFKNPVYSIAFSPDGKNVLSASLENSAKIVRIKMPLNQFLKECEPEELSAEQELQYGIIQFDHLNKERDTKRLLDGIKYCLSEATRQKNNKTEYTEEAAFLFNKLSGEELNPKYRELFIVNGLELYDLQPKKAILDKIELTDQLYLSSHTKEDIKDAYDYYSKRCSITDSIKILLKIPDNFILISRRLKNADTSFRRVVSSDLSALSWPLVQNRKYKTSLEAINLALEADSTNPYIYTIYPLILLMNNRFDEARKVYLSHYKETVYKNYIKSNKLTYLDDINSLEKSGITHPDFARIKEMLNH